MKIVAIVGKSGSGKSYLMDKLKNIDNDLHFVKSYSTREIRKGDPKDKDTHTFVNMEYFEKNKHKAISIYTNGEYYNWIDINLFKEDKINIIAIDPKALNEELSLFCYENNIDLKTVYVFVEEDIRKQRLSNRGNKYKEEEHLSINKLDLDVLSSVYIYNNNNQEFKEDHIENVLKYIK